ncbi:MAG: TfoX/Sxy family protein [Melioribacteraceae bacterium]|nr:TfoX/Sxy family protein [Melioribacteraceae bacterium]
MKSELEILPNIGKVLARNLNEVGIHNYDELKKIGSVKALHKIKLELDDGCANMLFALEGAIRGIRWHDIPKEERRKLYDDLKQEIG